MLQHQRRVQVLYADAKVGDLRFLTNWATQFSFDFTPVDLSPYDIREKIQEADKEGRQFDVLLIESEYFDRVMGIMTPLYGLDIIHELANLFEEHQIAVVVLSVYDRYIGPGDFPEKVGELLRTGLVDLCFTKPLAHKRQWEQLRAVASQ